MKKDKEEDAGFVPPKFDRVKFVKDEMRDAKASFVSVALGILMAFVSFGLLITTDNVLIPALLGLFFLVILKMVYQGVNIDTSEFGAKNWGGGAIYYLLSWLAIWILLVNPPVYDISSPDVNLITAKTIEAWPGDQTQNITIAAKVYDNDALASVEIEFEKIPEADDGLEEFVPYPMASENGRYVFEHPSNFMLGTYKYKVIAKDDVGQTTETELRTLDIKPSEDPIFVTDLDLYKGGSRVDDGEINLKIKDTSGIEKATYAHIDDEGNTSVKVSEAKINSPRSGEDQWGVVIDLKNWPSGNHMLNLTIVDGVGNKVTEILDFRI